MKWLSASRGSSVEQLLVVTDPGREGQMLPVFLMQNCPDPAASARVAWTRYREGKSGEVSPRGLPLAVAKAALGRRERKQPSVKRRGTAAR